MIMAAAVGVVLAVVRLRGRSLRPLLTVELRLLWLLPIAAVAQVAVLRIWSDTLDTTVAAGVHVASYAVAGAVVVANRRVPGMWLVGLGGLSNAVAIVANGGVMPASPSALAAAGRQVVPEGFKNSAPLADPVLLPLGDVLVWPAPLPLATPFSVGDVVIVVGVAWLVHVVTRPSAEDRAEPRSDRPRTKRGAKRAPRASGAPQRPT